MAVPEIRVVNLGIDLTRTFLQLTQSVVDTVLGGSIGVLDTIESKLPDIPLVSRPGVAGATRYALPPGRMRALPPGRTAPGYSQPAQIQPMWPGAGVIEI